MPGPSEKRVLFRRLSIALPLCLVAAVVAILVCSQDLSSKSGPPIASASPLRRLGNSDFRLTANTSSRRLFCFSPDGKKIAAANWDEVRVWSFPDGKLLQDFSEVIDSNCIAFSASGAELVALEQREMTVYRFDVETGRVTTKVPLADVESEKGATRYWISADGRWLCTTEVYCHVTVWDTQTGERRLRMQMQRMRPYYAPVSSEGVLTLWDNLFLEQYDVASGEKLNESRHYQKLIGPVSNPEGTLMAAFSTEDQAIVFWDPATGERVGGKIPTQQRSWSPDQGAISANGKRFAFWIADGTKVFNRRQAVFDVATGVPINSFASPDIYFTANPVISPEGKYVFPAGGRSVFTPVDTETGRVVRETHDHVLRITSLAFTPDGRILIVGSSDKSQAWDVETGQPGKVYERWHSSPSVAAIDNDQVLVSGLREGGLRLHNVSTGKAERHYPEKLTQRLSSYQLSPDRESFVGSFNGAGGSIVRRIDIATGTTSAESELPPRGRELQLWDPNAYHGLAPGGGRLIKFDQVRPPAQRTDGTFDWGQTDLLLEDWATQQIANRLKLPAYGRFALAGTADCKWLAAVVSDEWHPQDHHGYGPGSTWLLVWNLDTGVEQLRLEKQRDDYFSSFAGVAISAGGKLAATTRRHSRIEIWNGLSGELLQEMDGRNPVTLLAFSEDGAMLASGHQDGSVRLWNTRPAWKLTTP